MATKRLFVEKKKGFDIEAQAMCRDLQENLGLKSIESVRVINRYDIEGLEGEELEKAKTIVFSEPQVDNLYEEELNIENGRYFAIEYLPGQYDQRADSAAQCVQIVTTKEKPCVKTAKIIVVEGNISDDDFETVKNYSVNPVESRFASLEKPETLEEISEIPADVKVLDGFIDLDENGLKNFLREYGLAMDLDDVKFCQNYFKNEEKRNPSITEVRMIDTYWSDHCRHTTFSTKLNNIEIEDDIIKETYEEYLKSREYVYRGKTAKPICLMDLALAAMKDLRKQGVLDKLDESEEINACSIEVDVDIEGSKKPEKWLVMFKNETHNHPTEIEPFGGAATCLGGAIRDPLSGRSYVYQAMRVTGSGDPRKSLKETLEGKLPQRKITTGAAQGYSSYGNQIGLATGQVAEIYDEGYVAKRMEIGAVIAAAPKENVIREVPEAGDKIILLGGKTGRDGCGGATGSSKAHDNTSLESCGAEVQKGNPPEERKIQRLFRRKEVTSLIRRCNDFGAGGVSVAIGELADGLVINLDKVSKKYEGLDGTELAISESQERMAVVVRAEDVNEFIAYADEENLEANVVAEVTENPRLVMNWRGKTICDISREFLNTNGAEKNMDVVVESADFDITSYNLEVGDGDLKSKIFSLMSNINIASQKGLVERFDSTIGAGTVFMPYGGKTQLTPQQNMVAKIPVIGKETNTATVMSFGYNPAVAKVNPFMGAVVAVVESVTKAVAAGADYTDIYLTFQEYFEKLGTDPKRWGKPFAALLGAYLVQKKLNIASIGGKDSMSGSFNDIDVPPTLASFAVAPLDAHKAVSSEFKKTGSRVVLLQCGYDDKMINFDSLKELCSNVHSLINKGVVRSAYALGNDVIMSAVCKMGFGNNIGFEFSDSINPDKLFTKFYGCMILELDDDVELHSNNYYIVIELGKTTEKAEVTLGNESVEISDIISAWTKPLEKVFPTNAKFDDMGMKKFEYTERLGITSKSVIAKPRVFIPVFPGTNCEYDTAKAFKNAGAEVDVQVFKNMKPEHITESVDRFVKSIKNAQIVMLPGGFSGGDEPDGSGKFIAAAFRNPKISEQVMELLYNRDGLMLGICNGFQALIKLGLVPFGKIVDMDDKCPTLTFNTIGRHISQIVSTRVASVKSPWLVGSEVGDIHQIAVSHGEGRFVASPEVIAEMEKNGQIATQYVDLDGNPTYEMPFNPNGSYYAIEGITSPDGRVFGKMGHSERKGNDIYKNIPGNKDQKLFENGVKYFN